MTKLFLLCQLMALLQCGLTMLQFEVLTVEYQDSLTDLVELWLISDLNEALVSWEKTSQTKTILYYCNYEWNTNYFVYNFKSYP